MRDPVREQVPGFTLSSKKPFDKHAAAAKAGGGMQPPVAATKAGVGFQPPSGTNVHFLPSPITRCCCGICTPDASGSEHFCSVSGKRCFAMCFSTGAPEGFGSRWPCNGCVDLGEPNAELVLTLTEGRGQEKVSSSHAHWQLRRHLLL